MFACTDKNFFCRLCAQPSLMQQALHLYWPQQSPSLQRSLRRSQLVEWEAWVGWGEWVAWEGWEAWCEILTIKLRMPSVGYFSQGGLMQYVIGAWELFSSYLTSSWKSRALSCSCNLLGSQYHLRGLTIPKCCCAERHYPLFHLHTFITMYVNCVFGLTIGDKC